VSESAAVALLEQLQRASYETWHLTPPTDEPEFQQFTDDFVVRFIETRFPEESPEERAGRVAEALAEMKGWSPLTRYEDPGWRALMIQFAADIRESAAEANFSVSPEPVLGTLPTGQVNAKTVLVPQSGDHLVLFEWQMFLFALLFSKAICRAMPMEGRDGGFLLFSVDEAKVRQRIDEDPSIAHRFIDLIVAYAVTGLPGRAKSYLVEPQYAGPSDLLRRSMELFVLAHEYGHVGLGHLSAAARAEEANLSGAEVIAYSWQQEREADAVGLNLMLRAMMRSGMDAALSYWGADAYFSAIDVMRNAVAVLRTGTEAPAASATHPPSTERRTFLRAVLPQMIGEEDAHGAIDLGRQIELITELLWNRARAVLIELHERGVRPAAWWLG
jgi:hypothetical protein